MNILTIVYANIFVVLKIVVLTIEVEHARRPPLGPFNDKSFWTI